MLANILKLQYDQFASLAEAWLASGATAVGLWDMGYLLAQWPADLTEPLTEKADLIAPILSGDLVVGDLRVTGLNGSVAQGRLEVDAQLLTHLIKLEDEMEDMTAELIESQDQLLALYDLTQSTRSHLDMSQTLQSLARVTVRLVNAQASFMLLEKSGYLEVVSYPTALIDNTVLYELFHQLQQHQNELILNMRTAPEKLPSGIYNLCLVPINVGGSVIAALGLLNNPYGFAPTEMQLVRSIAGQAAAKLENLLLHQEMLGRAKLQTEMELATEAQLNLLPQSPPYVEGLDIFAMSRPALHVGGDFYDFIYQPGRPFIFSLGDVAGKGMSAALLMAMTRTAIRSKANFMPRATPEMIMNRSHDDLYSDFSQVRKFATVFVGQYTPEQRRLLYTNAGHSPVVYCPCGGRASLLEANGTALGALHIHPYGNEMLHLQPGDVLIVATDGFSEARNRARDMFGFERLLALTETLVSASAQEIAQAWFDAIDTFEADYPQDDDQTLIVIKVQPDENL